MNIILCIELNKGEFLDNNVVRLERGWSLHFVRGNGLFARHLLLRIHEADIEYSFPGTQSIEHLDSRIYRSFNCDRFGAFKYEFFDVEEDPKSPAGGGYFCVVPEWQIANGQKKLTLNSLSLITHLAKLLGPLNQWEERLKVAKEAGYNAIHLTPVQKLGISNSSYSIAEYDQLNSTLEADFDALKQFVDRMEHEWEMLTIQDVVWNHAAKNAKWLQNHPECAFNCENSPHLRPAYVLDRALQQFSREIGEGKWEHQGIPPVIDEQSHLSALRDVLRTDIFPAIRLHEFFQADEKQQSDEFNTAIKELKQKAAKRTNGTETQSVKLIPSPKFCRFGCTIDMELAVGVFGPKDFVDDATETESFQRFTAHLRFLNKEAIQTMDGHVAAAIDAIMGHVHYERVTEHGPRKGAVTSKRPLVTNYFLHPPEFGANIWQEDEEVIFKSPSSACRLMACNGWVMNADPLVNFAEWPSQVYLRRELVAWGDCIKLNYRQRPEDCPFLWDYMRRYSEQCARIFHGFRIDNCHSTPIHVAEYLLRAARRIRKDLYVIAELFTGSEELDNQFVNRLGITSLIREAQNAPNSHEQGRFVYRYGGDPVGAFRCKSSRAAPWTVAHAVFYDQTHDNPSPSQKRTPYDFVPTAAMCSISDSASGTVRGYDEFVAHNIDVVKEERLYSKWSEFPDSAKGMIRARRLLNDLHIQLSETGFSEIFVDQVNEDIVAVTRHNPSTRQSILLVAHTCFSTFKWTPNCRPIHIADDIAGILFELKMVEEPERAQVGVGVRQTNESNSTDRVITGLQHFYVKCFENVELDASEAIEIRGGAIHFKLFLSGSVVALKINPKIETKIACQQIESTIAEETMRNEAKTLLNKLSLRHFNYLLFCSEPEERDELGSGAFEVPNYGKLVYCGLKGIQTILERIQQRNDLGHPFCENLRQGTWLLDYSIDRLSRHPSLQLLASLLTNAFAPLKQLPHFLRPCYFELLFTYFYSAIEEVLLEKLFYRANVCRINLSELLVISSVAFMGHISSAKLPPISPEGKSMADSINGTELLSLSAGLPHFAAGIWRNWGRDTFIALPGLLLLTGRHEDARAIILAFATTLRHGLIPNLLAEGKTPRYNCRDAVWFWLVAIIRYTEMVENGEQILEEPVPRLYPTDDAEYGESTKVEPLHATMYEALCRHFEGIGFRERNAGNGIDEHMRHEGFEVKALIDKESGLVFGGNRWNCGTWMDKMGSSERAGNRGEPATPRDGAAVELQGLSFRVAQGLSRLSQTGAFPYTELKGKDRTTSWTWSEWASKIQQSFAKHFFVDEDCDGKYVNRRNIIKDSHGSSLEYTDYQLRPNFCIALDAAPNILPLEQAWLALKTAGEVLASNSPLGICTLDPEDWAYNGFYNNDDDGTNKATAKGWNYHQGPEWLWVAACYMSAKLKVASLLLRQGGDSAAWLSTVDEVRARLFRLEQCLRGSDWASLPELTNKEGAPCAHSCPAQAWSVGCTLETLDTLNATLVDVQQRGESVAEDRREGRRYY